jgi:hypothetical protein
MQILKKTEVEGLFLVPFWNSVESKPGIDQRKPCLSNISEGRKGSPRKFLRRELTIKHLETLGNYWK